jgi:hypothetical protein
VVSKICSPRPAWEVEVNRRKKKRKNSFVFFLARGLSICVPLLAAYSFPLHFTLIPQFPQCPFFGSAFGLSSVPPPCQVPFWGKPAKPFGTKREATFQAYIHPLGSKTEAVPTGHGPFSRPFSRLFPLTTLEAKCTFETVVSLRSLVN